MAASEVHHPADDEDHSGGTVYHERRQDFLLRLWSVLAGHAGHSELAAQGSLYL